MVEITNLKMQLLVVVCWVALTVAVPLPPNNNNDEIRRYENDNTGLGNYGYYVETSDGTKQEQLGELRNEGRDNQFIAVKGFYSWVAPNNVEYLVTYTADEDGYKSVIKEVGQERPGSFSPSVSSSLLGGGGGGSGAAGGGGGGGGGGGRASFLAALLG